MTSRRAQSPAWKADDLLAWIIVTLPGAEFQALLTESNQIVAALRLTTHIEELANAGVTFTDWLNR